MVIWCVDIVIPINTCLVQNTPCAQHTLDDTQKCFTNIPSVQNYKITFEHKFPATLQEECLLPKCGSLSGHQELDKIIAS
jgi:hypothetical protein